MLMNEYTVSKFTRTGTRAKAILKNSDGEVYLHTVVDLTLQRITHVAVYEGETWCFEFRPTHAESEPLMTIVRRYQCSLMRA